MLRLALIQHASDIDREETVNRVEMLVRQAASDGANLICLPEVFYAPFAMTQLGYEFFEVAETIPGPITDRMSALAAQLGVVMVVPVYEHAARGIYYNTAAVIDSDGRLIGRYRKQHIPLSPIFYEKLYFKPGNLGYPVFDTSVAKVGVYICHDRHYPEGARILALGGAEVILIPVATPTASLSSQVFELEIQAHAVFNEVFVAAVNRVGQEGEYSYYGRSLICGPDGQILAQAGDGEETLMADLDLKEIDERRLRWQFYRDRRPTTYGPIVEEIP
ncbi:MAG: nitrilase-related carbon-nitrogen hydrolase [Acidimicrobiia bacterium]